MTTPKGEDQDRKAQEGDEIKAGNDVPLSIVHLVNVIADRVDPVIKIWTTVAERALKSKVVETRFKTGMALVAVLLVIIIVGVSGFLTYHGRLDGASFTFLLGLLVGYVLSFIRDAIFPPTE